MSTPNIDINGAFDSLKTFAETRLSRRLLWQIPLGVGTFATVSILSLSIYAHMVWQKQQKELASEEELSKLNGKYFTRASDGKKIEYFQLNPQTPNSMDVASKRALIAIHGSLGTGYGFANVKQKELIELLTKHNIRLICPSLPGAGCSEPLLIDDCKQGIDTIASDLIQLLQTLNVNQVYCIGYSYGGEIAFYLAQKLLEMETETQEEDDEEETGASNNNSIKMRGVISIAGQPWGTTKYNPNAVREDLDSSFKRLFMKLYEYYCTLIPAAYWMLRPLLSSKESVKQMFEIENEKDQDENLIEIQCDDLMRTCEYFIDGLVRPTYWVLQRKDDFITDYGYFNNVKTKIHLHYGKNDKVVPMKSRKFVMDQLNYAEYFEYNCGHEPQPFVEAIKIMLESDTPQS